MRVGWDEGAEKCMRVEKAKKIRESCWSRERFH